LGAAFAVPVIRAIADRTARRVPMLDMDRAFAKPQKAIASLAGAHRHSCFARAPEPGIRL
jgi:hypothetical protein